MTKRTSAKYKIDRRMGENIWGRPKSPVNRREYGPGQHGQRRKGKMSDFGTQLRAKQKLKGYYGDLTEKQFRRIFAEAERLRGDTGEMLVGLLERLESGTVEVRCVDLNGPSPLAAEIINARPYAFLDDGEAEERRTRAISSSPDDLGSAAMLRIISVEAETQVPQEAWIR